MADSTNPPGTGPGAGDPDEMVIDLTEVIEEPPRPAAAPGPPPAPPPVTEPPEPRIFEPGPSMPEPAPAPPPEPPPPPEPEPAPQPPADKGLGQDDLDALLRELGASPGASPGPSSPEPTPATGGWIEPEAPAPATRDNLGQDDLDSLLRDLSGPEETSLGRPPAPGPRPSTPPPPPPPPPLDLSEDLTFPEKTARTLPDDTEAFFRDIGPGERPAGEPDFPDAPEASSGEGDLVQADLNALLAELEEQKPVEAEILPPEPAIEADVEAEESMTQADLDAMLREIEEEKPPPSMLSELEEEAPPSSIVEDARSVSGEGAESELDALLKEVEAIQVPSEAEVIEPEMAMPDPDHPDMALDDEAFGATPLVLGVADAAAEETDPARLRETVRSVLEELLPQMVRPIIIAEIQEIIKALKRPPES